MTSKPYTPGQNGGANTAGVYVGNVVGTLWAALPAWLAAKAVKNHFAYSGDPIEAAWLGATAGRRWNHFTYGVIYAAVWFMVPATWLVTVPLLLVVYNRNMDASLFKRGWLYQLVRPLAAITTWLPTAVLYIAVVVTPFIINSVV